MGKKILALDGLRGFAIALMVIFHCVTLTGTDSLSYLLSGILQSLWFSVHLFFALSGFLITRILLDTKGSPRYLRNFYARRALRILPLYYLVLFLLLHVMPRSSLAEFEPLRQIKSELPFWLFFRNHELAANQGSLPFVDVSWTVCIEEQFYLLWPCFVALLNGKNLARFCLFTFPAAFLFRYWLWRTGNGGPATYFLTAARFDAIAAGAFVALIERSSSTIKLQCVKYRSPALCFLSAIAGLMFLHTRGNSYDPLISTIGQGVLALWAGTMVFHLTTSRGFLTRCFETRPLRILGRYSYAIYLLHLPIQALIKSWNPPPLLFHGLFWVFLVGLSALVFHGYEAPFLRLKRYFQVTPTRRESFA